MNRFIRNSGVTGVVHDEDGVGLAGIHVEVRRRFLCTTRTLGTATTDDAGRFHIPCPPTRRPKLEIELTDVVGRRLAVRVFPAVSGPMFDTTWVVPNAEARGWVATGEGAFPPTHGNDIGLLIDNEDAWAAVLDAVDAARESIHFMLFFLDVGHTFLKFGDTVDLRYRLEDALMRAAHRGVDVKLLLNDFPIRATDTASAVERALLGVPGVEMRRFVVKIAPIHAKFLIIDRQDPARVSAYVIGSPFVQDYFAGTDHSLHDPRHGESRWPQKQLNVPVHDVSARVRGPAVARLDETFLLHWNQVRPQGAPEVPAAPTPPTEAGSTTIQVTRTVGGRIFPGRPRGETAIWESYLRAIASAREYIYLENQYFTLDILTDALIRAVKRNGIELILATNNNVDIPLYTQWQRGQVERLLAGLTPRERERVGVFTLWTHEEGLTAGSPSRIGRIYVHSKVAIVDDVWATVGSANIDGVSLTSSDYLGWFDSTVRSTETNVVVLGQGAGGSPTDLPATLRRQLWSEHLGLDEAALVRPATGWVGLWNERARAKRTSLQAVPAILHPSRVLAWPVAEDGARIDTVEGYLGALGITPRGSPPSFESVEDFDFYDFETGEWKPKG